MNKKDSWLFWWTLYLTVSDVEGTLIHLIYWKRSICSTIMRILNLSASNLHVECIEKLELNIKLVRMNDLNYAISWSLMKLIGILGYLLLVYWFMIVLLSIRGGKVHDYCKLCFLWMLVALEFFFFLTTKEELKYGCVDMCYSIRYLFNWMQLPTYILIAFV